MTELLYMRDCYLKEFEAIIRDVRYENSSAFVILDKTAFYPESGGQPNDTGLLIDSSGNEYVVKNVKKQGQDIIHIIDKPDKMDVIKPGDRIKGAIDWDRRYRLMRYHTAAHVLSAIIFKETNAMITGNQLSLEKGRIDFNLENLNKEKINNYEKKANDIIAMALPVHTKVLPSEEAFKIPNILRLKKLLPPMLKKIRIIDIEGFDQQACGGTHVKNTSEIKGIEVIGVENKGKNNRRIYFKLAD